MDSDELVKSSMLMFELSKTSEAQDSMILPIELDKEGREGRRAPSRRSWVNIRSLCSVVGFLHGLTTPAQFTKVST